ncbi:MAG: hypothetical protein IE916_00505 [Epsilonproteobacteria bacterium]|nr:hypothetical protein [Campylobacterota bacterium]
MAGHLPLLNENGGCKFFHDLGDLTYGELSAAINEIKEVFGGMARAITFMSPWDETKRDGRKHIGKLRKLPHVYAAFTEEEEGRKEGSLEAYIYSPKLLKDKNFLGTFEVHYVAEMKSEKIVQIYYVA